MPCKNIVKIYDVDSYYHIYNRGVEKRKIFLDDQDYSVFLALIKRYLSHDSCAVRQGRTYECLAEDVELVSFCLMPNHFHLMLYQIKMNAVTKLLRAICSSYVTYFNQKYGRVGTLFQGNFKAVKVNSDEYLLYLSRYIHRNPADYLHWEWSSLVYWLGVRKADWLNLHRLNGFNSDEYLDFISDDTDYKTTLDQIDNYLL